MSWYPRSDSDWYPHRPTPAQVALGVALLLALTGLWLFWAADEPDPGNRTFLLAMAGLTLALATWRIAIGVRLLREDRRRRRLDSGL